MTQEMEDIWMVYEATKMHSSVLWGKPAVKRAGFVVFEMKVFVKIQFCQLCFIGTVRNMLD